MIDEDSIRDDDHHDADCNCYRCTPDHCKECGNDTVKIGEDDLCDPCRKEHMERMIAFSEYQQHKERLAREKEQEECPHDENDHGICLDCGKDIMDDLIDRAEMMRDE